MKAEQISDAIGLLHDDFIQETDAVRQSRPSLFRSRRFWTAAACLCAVLVLLFPFAAHPTRGSLPTLKLPDLSGGSNGMGFEGILLYSFDEWSSGSPWKETMSFSTLPAYRNGSYDPAGEPTGLGKAEMTKQLQATAEALGIELETTQAHRDGRLPFTLTSVTAQADGVSLEAEADGTVTVEFEGGLSLPEDISFLYYDLLPEEAAHTLTYLSEQFSALTGFSQPVQALSGSYVLWNDYDQTGTYIVMPKYEYTYLLYEGAGDDRSDLLSFSFQTVQFYPDENGKLWIIRLRDRLSTAQYLGDYPIITAQEALSLLMEGSYLTNVPYPIEEDATVAYVELMYRSSRLDPILMPYYRFYVELPEMERDNGLKEYGAYYVPAIERQYLENMPSGNS